MGINLIIYLFFSALPKPKEMVKREFTYERRVFQEIKLDLWQEPDAKATFTFKLRPRLIQSGIGVKLLACLSGRPTPTVQWYKNNKPISESDPHYAIEYSAGVCTLEINSCSLSDNANYKCRAENALGFDETSAHLQIEECKYVKPQMLLIEENSIHHTTSSYSSSSYSSSSHSHSINSSSHHHTSSTIDFSSNSISKQILT